MLSKKWWRSKTIIVSVGAIICGVIGAAAAGEYTGFAGYAVAIMGAIMAVLRLVTTQPVE